MNMRKLLTTLAICFIASSIYSQTFRSVMFNPPPVTDDGLEFFEIMGPPNKSLYNLYFIEIVGLGNNAATGTIRNVKYLGDYKLGSNGLLLWRDRPVTIKPAPSPETTVVTGDFNPDLHNGTNTVMIVSGFYGNVGDDIDDDNDGTPNDGDMPWDEVITALSVKGSFADDTYYADDFYGGSYITTPVNKHFAFFINNQWKYALVTGDANGMTIVDGAHAGAKITPGRTISVLPVDLAKFSVRNQKNSALLEWQTASEQNNAGFDVEKSADGIRFTSIATIAGAGNSNQTLAYSYTDHNPTNGINYYRLKQTDFDGTSSYSSVQSIRFAHGVSVSVRPAVANSQLTISFSTELDEETTIEVYEMASGIKVATALVQAGNKEYILNTESFSAGTYVAVLSNGTATENVRFMVHR